MSLIYTEIKVYEPQVKQCICGGIPEHKAKYCDEGCYSGAAYIQCPNCGLQMDEYSTKLGFNGITLLSLYQKVVTRWNKVMPV